MDHAHGAVTLFLWQGGMRSHPSTVHTGFMAVRSSSEVDTKNVEIKRKTVYYGERESKYPYFFILTPPKSYSVEIRAIQP